MKLKTGIILFFIVFKLQAQETNFVIPKPVSYQTGQGSFDLNHRIYISSNSNQLLKVSDYFKENLFNNKGRSVKEDKNKFNVQLVLEPGSNQVKESYKLTITAKKIIISSATVHGVFNGVNTLLQLIQFSKNNRLNTCTITDQPKYSWRGFMLDESRHFFGKEKVKSILNWMAFYKLNTLHWHLTDEPGWRLEILKYPKLSAIGGKGDYTNPDKPVQYYTQADIKEIVAYAADRFIQVVPEIDMPGHAAAANRAYPEFSGGGSARFPNFTFNPGKTGTYTYLTDILKEVNSLFPSKMIHLGGDEVSMGNEKWKLMPEIDSLKLKYNLRSDKEAETYFMKRMADSVYKLKAKVLVWDEMVEAGLPVDKTIMFWWRHDRLNQLTEALNKGYETVLCPRLPLYFDFVQDSLHKYGRKWSKKYNAVQDVYNFSMDGAAIQNQEKIIGLQANLWTETVSDVKRLEYLLFPRIAALAEIAWTKGDQKDLNTFMLKLQSHIALYKQNGIYYYNPFMRDENAEPPSLKRITQNVKD